MSITGSSGHTRKGHGKRRSQCFRNCWAPKIEALEDRLLPSGNPQLLKDIKIEAPNAFSRYDFFVQVNGAVLFAASDGTHGVELWRSNGTTAGTQLVKDINPGPSGSYPASYPFGLANVGETLFFAANDGTHGTAFWRSDGTAAGTQMVKGIYSGSKSSLGDLTNINGTLFFLATDGTHGSALWRSDGSTAGTRMVDDLAHASSFSDTYWVANVGGTFFFDASDGTHGAELWRSNGAAAGTQMVKDIDPGSGGSYPSEFVNVNGTLFFTADDSTHGYQLWRSDGTNLGTRMVKDIGTGSSAPAFQTNFEGTLFFDANDGTHGYELWRSDGTDAGTQMVTDIFSGIGTSVPYSCTNVGGALFFVANDGHGEELWGSDGTTAGTQLVKDIYPGSHVYHAGDLTNVAGTLFFQAQDATHGAELWRSDGSVAGTQMVHDINPGSKGSYPSFLTNIGGTLFFSADDGVHGPAPWILPVTGAQATTTSLSITRSGSDSFGDAITFAVHISTAGPGSFAKTTGTVAFKDGLTTLASGVPLTNLTAADGTATLVLAAGNTLAAGPHHFVAVYSGDSNLATSDDSQNATIAQAVPQTTLVVFTFTTGNTHVYGQNNWAAVAAVRALPGFSAAPPADGSVLFTDTILTNSTSSGAFLLGGKTTVTLGSVSVGAGGVAVLNAGQAEPFLLPGAMTIFNSNGTPGNISPVAHTITAQYTGDVDFAASADSNGVTVIVSRDPTVAVITGVTPSTVQFGQIVTLTATITTVGGGLIAPLGTVTFTDSYTVGSTTTNTTLGTVNLPSVASGVIQAQATFTTASLTQHAHTLKAIYNGDTNAPFPLPRSFPFRGQWLPSTSAGYGFVVHGDQTTGTLSANPSGGQKAGATITFVDSLTATAGGTVSGGVVTFKDGTRVLGMMSVNGGGKATLVTSIAGPMATHSITAYYGGSMNFNPSTSNTLVYTITAASAATDLVVARMTGVNPGTPRQLKDIIAGTRGGFDALPLSNSFVETNELVFFKANDGTHGFELWRSDGTSAGTQMVKDIDPGSNGSNPDWLTNVSGTLFFAASDGMHGSQLWRSDGSAGGTKLVEDINSYTGPYELINVAGTLFFDTCDGTHGAQLWRSDGTAAGTQMVKEFNTGVIADGPYHLTNVAGTLFFGADDGTHGFTLWRSDGTMAGTQMIKDIPLGFGRSALIDVSGTAFFSAGDGNGSELWRSDGTAAGTRMVDYVAPRLLTNVNGTLFFDGYTSTHGYELWRSDGTAAGTRIVRDTNTNGSLFYPSYLTNAGGTLFFAASDGTLWRSNGTASGTQMVKDVNLFIPSEPNGFYYHPRYLADVSGTLFFRASDGGPYEGPDGFELWRSDGTVEGTQMVQDSGGGGFYAPYFLTNARGTLFFSAASQPFGDLVPWALPITQAPTTSTSIKFTPGGSKFFGDAVTLTATVEPQSINYSLTGTVTFLDGTKTLASGVTLNSIGQATYSSSTLSAGTHTISARYTDDPLFLPSTSLETSLVISQAVTRTTVALSSASSVYGQGFLATATVSAVPGMGMGTPTTGSVLFTDILLTNADASGHFLLGGKTTLTIGRRPVDASGKAVLDATVAAGLVLPGVITGYLNNGQPANLSPVSHFIKAQYQGGSANFAGSPNPSTSAREVISQDQTETTIKVSPTPSRFGQAVTITGTVRSLGGSFLGPIGTVTFLDSYTVGGVTTNTKLGTVALPLAPRGVTAATATFTISTLARGTHVLRVHYNGDAQAPFPLPTAFPFRDQWIPSNSVGYSQMVTGNAIVALSASAPPSPGSTPGPFVTPSSAGAGSKASEPAELAKGGSVAALRGSFSIAFDSRPAATAVSAHPALVARRRPDPNDVGDSENALG
jgi:ELWxxDGT repeat protein